MLERAKEKVTNGIVIENFMVYAKRISKGRFREEVNLDIYLRGQKEEEHLLFIKVFHGRKPTYRPWVEFFGINSSVTLCGEVIDYFNSVFEDELLSLFSQFLGPAEDFYVEYYNDEETRRQLEVGVPPSVTRLGYKLFKLGFTWFKDWYFPEGFMEGGQKLQGEKPLDDAARNRQLEMIYSGLRVFLDKAGSFN